MNARIFSILPFVCAASGIVLMASCSTGIFFADDNQEGHVGFLSATQYSNVSDVLIMEKGAAPKLTEFAEQHSKPFVPARISEPTPVVATVTTTDTLLKVDQKIANAAPRYDIPVLEAKKQPVVHSTFVSSPR